MNGNRLLLLTPDFPPNHGGVARYLSRLANYFAERITVVTSVAGAVQSSPFPVIEQPLLSKFFWPQWLTSVAHFIKLRSSYDIVITSHLIPFGTAALLTSFVTKKPFVVIVHGMDVRLATKNFIKKKLARIVLKHARIIVANSRALSQEVAETFGVALPLVVYPCMESLPKNKSHLTTDRELSVIPIKLLTVGRLIKRKNHTQVLMALAELKQSQFIPKFSYDIVGQGPMEETLKELAWQLHLDEVKFHGAIDDEQVNQLYTNADLFVMPVLDDKFDKEGFGYVFLEAASYGLPSISTRISGVDEAIIDRETGLLIQPNNQNDLSRAISELMNNTKLRLQLGEKAKTHVEQNFICAHQFSKLEAYL